MVFWGVASCLGIFQRSRHWARRSFLGGLLGRSTYAEGTSPLAMLVWIRGAGLPRRGRFGSLREWGTILSNEGTHPGPGRIARHRVPHDFHRAFRPPTRSRFPHGSSVLDPSRVPILVGGRPLLRSLGVRHISFPGASQGEAGHTGCRQVLPRQQGISYPARIPSPYPLLLLHSIWQ